MSMEIIQFSQNIFFTSKWNSQRKYEFTRVEVEKKQNFTNFLKKQASVNQIHIFTHNPFELNVESNVDTIHDDVDVAHWDSILFIAMCGF